MNDMTKSQGQGLRVFFAVTLALLVISYTFAVLLGEIPEKQRIDTVHFGIIIFTGVLVLFLLKPNFADRLIRFEGAGFKLEMLEQVKEKQDKQAQALYEQANLLDDISLVLPLLLPKTERKHLINLDSGRTSAYKGQGTLRSEIRRLRSIGLIEMLSNCHVSQMETGKEFDLANYVQLTNLGHHWVKRIKQIEEKEQGGDETEVELDEQK